MARIVKIDSAFKKRFERQEKKRLINRRDYRLFYLIVCEGEKTEPNYFKSFEKELPVGVIKLEIEGTGRNTSGLVRHAIELNKQSNRKFDRIWAVFDKDSFPAINFNSAIAIADANKINCAWSNEAFELWFLLHFQLVNNAMHRDDYKAYLEREIKRNSDNEHYRYIKNAPDTYEILKEFGNQNLAIRRAKKLKLSHTDQNYSRHNPCTLVYELIEELLNHKYTSK